MYNTTTADVNSSLLCHDDVIDGPTLDLVSVLLHVGVNGVIALWGVVANILNIIVFKKQGTRESITISLLVLAVTDLLNCLFLLWESVCLNPLFLSAGLPFVARDIDHFTSVMPRGVSVRISWWIITLTILERCLCIALPLKVKHIVTRRRTITALVTISLLTTAIMMPLWLSSRLTPQTQGNRTVLARVPAANSKLLNDVSYFMNLVWQLGAYLLTIVCTAVMIRQLRSLTSWRCHGSHVTQRHVLRKLTSRDMRAAKAVTFVSCVYITCAFPSCVIFLLELSLSCSQQNLYFLLWAVAFTLEAINSAVHIFIYYHFHIILQQVFGLIQAFVLVKKTIE
ncbi:uncharacterized protein LOC131937838 [Physella acuta]|uniref:uncharacterized protein LOC131937838 n=1 Tax=Physella acuta TaxID=109671 RepID=UPI0027DDAA6C|nr:uncharacterized protein LOC131937838 [Physella acuta]